MNKEKGAKYTVDNDLHIHSKLSLCSNDPEQTNERILQYAEENHLKTICLTDHFWDETVPGASPWYSEQNFGHISQAKPLPQSKGIDFLFGCETEMDLNMTLGISKERFDEFDFVVIPTTHFHMTGFTTPESVSTPKQKADYWVKRFSAVLDMDLPFHKIGIAHLTCGLICKTREEFLSTVDSISDRDLEKVFEGASEKRVGIELNSDDMNFKDSEAATVLRVYKIAKEKGCKFYLGSDAHHPKTLYGAKAIFERAIGVLKLTEEDKFAVSKKS